MKALILIDIQKGFDDSRWGARNNPAAETIAARILAHWRSHQRPLFHVRHDSAQVDSPLHPDRGGNNFKESAQPLAGEIIIRKRVNSAFIGTRLEEELRRAKVQEVVFVGLTTPHCVSTSARMAGNLGFRTFVVSDATAAFEWRAHDGTVVSADSMHFHALAALHDEFATVISSEELLMQHAESA
jgi:nicotinamidase-related amidase